MSNSTTTAADLLPFYLIDQDNVPLADAPRFADEDDAYDWVETNLGEEAWNDTAILASDEVAS